MLIVSQDDAIARSNLRLAGAFQEIHSSWVRRLDSYFLELERLINGEWLDSSDLKALVRETRSASKEAMEGLSNDLISELMHATSKILERHAAEKNSLDEEIGDLRGRISRLMSFDESAALIENESMREALFDMTEFRVLAFLQTHTGCSYKELASITGRKSSALRKDVKLLAKRGYIRIDKNSRSHSLHFLSAPWNGESAATTQNHELSSNTSILPVGRL